MEARAWVYILEDKMIIDGDLQIKLPIPEEAYAFGRLFGTVTSPDDYKASVSFNVK